MKIPYKKTCLKGGFALAELVIYVGILGAIAGIFTAVLTTVTTTQVDEFAENEIGGQMSFTTQTIQRLIKSSSAIVNDAGTASSTLILTMPDPLLSPTRIYAENSRAYIQQGANAAQALTNEQVSVDFLEFRKFTQPGSKDVVQFDIALSKIQPSTGKLISRALRSAVSRVSAASFDDSLIPNADATYNIGSASYRWKDGFFSGDVSAGNFCLGGTCKSSWGQVAGVSGSGTATRLARWTASDTLGNSTIYDTGSAVGVGVISPSLALEVSGAGSFTTGVGAGTASLDSNYRITTSGGGIKAENASANPAGYFSSTGGGYSIRTATGSVLLADLAGSGTRSVIVSATGVLSATTTSASSQWTTDANGITFNSGSVGIGVASPSTPKLHLRKSALTYSSPSFFSTNAFLIEDTEGTMEFAADDTGNFGASFLLANIDGSTGAQKIWGILNRATDASNRFSIAYGTTTNINNYTGTTAERLVITTTGNVGIGTLSPVTKLHVTGTSTIISDTSFTPSTSTSTCTTGMYSWSSTFIYICTSTNTWKRATLNSF